MLVIKFRHLPHLLQLFHRRQLRQHEAQPLLLSYQHLNDILQIPHPVHHVPDIQLFIDLLSRLMYGFHLCPFLRVQVEH